MNSSSGHALNVGVRLQACLLACVILSGCWGGRTDGKVLVTGTVTLDGTPLPRGSVLFRPKTGDGGSGPVKSAGRFSVTLLPGEYQLLVRCDDGSATISEQGEYVPGKSLIPERYGDAATSELTVTVAPDMQPMRVELSSTSEPHAQPIAR